MCVCVCVLECAQRFCECALNAVAVPGIHASVCVQEHRSKRRDVNCMNTGVEMMEPFASKLAGAAHARARFWAVAVFLAALGATLQSFTWDAGASFVAREIMVETASAVASQFVGLRASCEAIPDRGNHFWGYFEKKVLERMTQSRHPRVAE